jgi:hypothetical protein
LKKGILYTFCIKNTFGKFSKKRKSLNCFCGKRILQVDIVFLKGSQCKLFSWIKVKTEKDGKIGEGEREKKERNKERDEGER